MYNAFSTGRGAVRLACLHGVQEVEGSNPFAPTEKTLGYFPGSFDINFPFFTGCQYAKPPHRQRWVGAKHPDNEFCFTRLVNYGCFAPTFRLTFFRQLDYF